MTLQERKVANILMAAQDTRQARSNKSPCKIDVSDTSISNIRHIVTPMQEKQKTHCKYCATEAQDTIAFMVQFRVEEKTFI